MDEVKIVLLAKEGEYANKLHSLLVNGGKNVVHETDENISTELLSYYDLGIVWFYRHILKPEQLNAVPLGIINNHCAYLPYGRGAMPNVWVLAYGEPAGVTLHYMDQGIDTGDIIAQTRVEVSPADTAQSLYERLVEEQYKLFTQFWTTIESLGTQGLKVPSFPQPKGEFRTHYMRDVRYIDDIDSRYGPDGRELINDLRARTFPPHEAMYFHEGGKKYYVRVQIEEAKEE
jgi:methionyl-tRNA formyltransferase